MEEFSQISRRRFVEFGASVVIGVSVGGLLVGCGGAKGPSHTITDMAGRVVAVPDTVTKAFCSNPIGTVDLYALAPEKLAGWNFIPAGDAQKYIDADSLKLPALGVWMGAGAVPNSEEIARISPDVIFCYWTADEVGANMADEIAKQTGFVVVSVDYDIRATPEMFRFVGGIIGEAKRAEELATFCEAKLELIENIVAGIPTDKRKRIFLSQGTDGLMTDPVGSLHVTDALELLDVGNVASMPGTEGKGMGMPSVNIEQIITWNPDAVLVAEYSMSNAESSDIYAELKADSRWHNIPCVAAGEVYRIPQAPFSWFGRPPSAVRIVGCLWLLHILYPDYTADLDMRGETREFYQTFYGVALDEAMLDAILNKH